jgi:hypothetical protein
MVDSLTGGILVAEALRDLRVLRLAMTKKD